MFPREHGAYGQLLLPLVTALAVGNPGWAAFAVAGAGIAFFLAHEPLLVLIGQRGVRAARERRGVAVRWLAALVAIAVGCGAVALVLAPPVVRAALLVPAAFVALLAVFVAGRRERTTAGEIVAAAALSSLALPTALAAGAPMPDALAAAMVYVVAFAAATLSVRAVIAGGAAGARSVRPRRAPSRLMSGVLTLFGVAALHQLSRRGFVAAAAPWAALPVCGVSLALVVVPPDQRRLRAVGWTLVVASVITGAVLVAALR